ncbi:SRPBCC family protein [Streptomyces sp. NBC_00019]|uniref:SRPBCC family protein n=1 Tax=Streptomyces sp. NBC_00019 TaxID=2975623 RepID=UPI00324B63F7
MTGKTPRSIEISVPADTAYEQYKRFEEYPVFLPGLAKVEVDGDTRVRWTYEAAGQQASLETEIFDDQPQRSVSLRLVEDGDHAWTTDFEPLGSDRCRVSQRSDGAGPADGAAFAAQLLAHMSASFLPQFKKHLETRAVQPK